VIAGGGTGGHLFPGIAVAEEIAARSPDSRVLFISRGNEFERTALERAGFPLASIAVEGLKGRGLWNQMRGLSRLPKGIVQSLLRLRAFQPEIVIGLGSYSAGPVVLAAWLLRIPIALCEQNTLPGVTNRLLSRLADRIFVAFEHTGGNFDPDRLRWTGNPLRRDIVSAVAHGKPFHPSDERRPFTVLVLGGSQGAHRLNTAVTEALDHLTDRQGFFFIHQTGLADAAAVASAYDCARVAARVQAFFTDMATHYLTAHLVICRAGATTVAEIAALGRPALFIPYPFAADDHQRLNARQMVAAGAAEMIEEQELSGERLAARIRFYAEHREILVEMAARAARLGRPDAAQRIVDECYRLIAARAAGRPADGPTG
jgi:UDP-N-acetylglucosamine--N-acetylmuramyl-(pentapeptide) pyrophosphoryl-undecaprenol N-acetylglucosamine transferase